MIGLALGIGSEIDSLQLYTWLVMIAVAKVGFKWKRFCMQQLPSIIQLNCWPNHLELIAPKLSRPECSATSADRQSPKTFIVLQLLVCPLSKMLLVSFTVHYINLHLSFDCVVIYTC